MNTTKGVKTIVYPVLDYFDLVDNSEAKSKNKTYKAIALLYSQHGELSEIEVLEKVDYCNYIVKYGGVKYTAVFNWFNCLFYVDDLNGEIKEIKNDLSQDF